MDEKSEATTIHVAAENVRESDCVNDGWDVDISVDLCIDNKGWKYLIGEVTLKPSEYNNEPTSWGRPENWIDNKLLNDIENLKLCNFSRVLDCICDAAIEKIIQYLDQQE